MKIAFDVDVLAKQMDINRMVHQVADWGYKIYRTVSTPTDQSILQASIIFKKNVRLNIEKHLERLE